MDELESKMAESDSAWKRLFDGPFGGEMVALKTAFDFELFVRCRQFGVVNDAEWVSSRLSDLDRKQTSTRTLQWNEYHLLMLKRKQFLCGRERSFATKTVLSKMAHDVTAHFRSKLLSGDCPFADAVYAKSVMLYH